jgi:hypothetical protein
MPNNFAMCLCRAKPFVVEQLERRIYSPELQGRGVCDRVEAAEWQFAVEISQANGSAPQVARPCLTAAPEVTRSNECGIVGLRGRSRKMT